MAELTGRLHRADSDLELGYRSGEDKINAVAEFLKNHKVLAYGHNHTSECEHLFVHEKGDKNIFAIMKVQGLIDWKDVTEEMRPPDWTPLKYLNEKFKRFFLISKVAFVEIEEDDYTDLEGHNLTCWNDMTRIKTNIKDPFT